jgi:hypothetical protein
MVRLVADAGEGCCRLHRLEGAYGTEISIRTGGDIVGLVQLTPLEGFRSCSLCSWYPPSPGCAMTNALVDYPSKGREMRNKL